MPDKTKDQYNYLKPAKFNLLSLFQGASLTSLLGFFAAYSVGEDQGATSDSLDGKLSAIKNKAFDGIDSFTSLFDGSSYTLWLSVLVVVGILAIKAIRSRVKTRKPIGKFFQEDGLEQVPSNRIGYSDRMAYVMAELAELAYHPVEMNEASIDKLIDMAQTKAKVDKDSEVFKALASFRQDLEGMYRTTADGNMIATEDELEKALINGNFTYISPYLTGVTNGYNKNAQARDIITELSAQGFVSVYKAAEPAKRYIVVSFRGSEARIEDWLTNADAWPVDLNIKNKNNEDENETEDNKNRIGRVHRGFYYAYKALKMQMIKNIEKAKSTYDLPDNCPVYFTGHSLGGAMATIATREYAPDSNGACYTFGAPRVGDYDYFAAMKTPIFRVVNSADLVPRVPPGFGMNAVKFPFKIMRFILGWRDGMRVESGWTGVVYSWFMKLEFVVDRLSHYRHVGDLRYLTDVQASKVTQAELLTNPCQFDRMVWFFKAIWLSFGQPVASHSMQIYRNKLTKIASSRMPDQTVPAKAPVKPISNAENATDY